ncbi:MAG: zinc ribbon domain-containing protein [Planctomycetes bacterium]|nr:zinc ribbon domain-containing protein [Planctomycetota bacterium]
MPIYEYRAKCACNACDYCREPFEVRQKITDDPLQACPHCGAELVKLISTPGAPRENILSPSNLAEKGFTQYKRSGKGHYEKTAGQGPDTLHDHRS